MSTDYGVKAVQPGKQTIYNVPANSGWVVIQNESPYKLSCSMDGTGSTRAIPIQSIDKLTIPTTGFNGNIILSPVSILNQQAIDQAPSYEVNLEAFGLNEEPTGVYPVALSRSVQVGGTVSTSGVPASSIVNSQSPAGTNIINARVPGDPADAVNLDNEGHLTLGNANWTGRLDLTYPGVVRWLTNPNNPSPNQWNMTTDSSNTLHLNSASGVLGRQFIVDGLGPVTIDAGNGMVNIVQSSPPVFNGTGAGSGTATLYQDLGGTLKRLVVYLNNFKNAGAALNCPLIVPFTTFAMWRVTDTAGFSLMKSGVAQTIRPVSTANGTQGATVTVFTGGFTYGDCLSGFDTIQYAGSGSAVHNGILELVGI